jgi:hypothetical protein
MKLERSGNLGEAEWHFALTKEVEHGKGSIESLNFVRALRSGVSHIDP